MIKNKKLIGDGILLTLTTLALKTAGVAFSSALTVSAGAEAMGLSGQITSVYAFALTAAAAGVNLGATRITAESLGSDNTADIRSGIRRALSYCIKTGFVTAILLFILAPILSGRVIGNAEATVPLRLLSLAIPCISVSGAFHGYFNGVRRVYKSATVNVLEQTARISLTLSGLYGLSGENGIFPRWLTETVSGTVSFIASKSELITTKTGLACLTVVAGSVAAELLSCFTLFILYTIDAKRYPAPSKTETKASKQKLNGKFLRITVPMAVSALLRSGLSSAEHLLLPWGLRAFGSESALAEYGTVSGMAIPVVLYPMALINAFAQLNTVDVATKLSAGEESNKIRQTIGGGILFALIYGVGCSAILRAFSYRLAVGIFSTETAGTFISVLAGYAALAYLNHIADSTLKGLDQQSYVMGVNIADSAIGLLLTVILVPRLGIYGYVISLYICELINCTLSL